MENSNFSAVETKKSSSKIWIVVVLVLLIGLGAVFYYFDFGGLFKGQMKLTQSKNDCVRLLNLGKDKAKVKQCLKSYPELVKSKTQTVVSAKSGFDNAPFKIVQLVVAPKLIKPEESLKMSTATEEPATIFKQLYYDKTDKEFAASVMYVLPSYNDPGMPPKISLPVGLQLCDSADKCAVVKQASISLSGSNQVNSGSLDFTRSELAEVVEYLGLNSSEVVKFRLSIKEPPNDNVIYTNYSEEVQIAKIQN